MAIDIHQRLAHIHDGHAKIRKLIQLILTNLHEAEAHTKLLENQKDPPQ